MIHILVIERGQCAKYFKGKNEQMFMNKIIVKKTPPVCRAKRQEDKSMFQD